MHFTFQSNTYFQAALHQAKSWKLSSDNFEKDFKNEQQRASIAEKQLKAKEEELAKAHAELVKLRSDKEDIIDEYMESQKFKDLMELHDEGLYPVQFSEGWDKAVAAISAKHPGVINPRDFVSPNLPQVEEDGDEWDDLLASPPPGDRIIDPDGTPLKTPGRASRSPSPSFEGEDKERDEDSPNQE